MSRKQATRQIPELQWTRMSTLLKHHPWHGVSIGTEAPSRVTCYIEMVPTDAVKYEVDKTTGYLKVDRPQKFSSVCPSLYGLIPQTYCAEQVAALCRKQTGRNGIVGDGDPLDICVLTEKPISHGDILVEAIPVGGLRMIDNNQADDKIIAVLKNDAVYGDWRDVSDCPPEVIERLRHYFLTYKDTPGTAKRACEIVQVYDREGAHEVIRKSREDYHKKFSDLEELWRSALGHSSAHA